jgi:hypothetical protein
MIGFLTHPTGRLGNILLQFLFLKEISYYTNVPAFHGTLTASDLFENLNKTENYQKAKSNIINRKYFNNSTIDKWGIDKFSAYVKSSKRNIILSPPVLGHTFETMYKDPNSFLSLQKKYQIPYYNFTDKFVIALHFRGTDFAQWNSEACLDPQYYIDSIVYCRNRFGNLPLFFSLFTDDTELESYKYTINFFKDNDISFHSGNPFSKIGEEIYNLSMSDIIISSPSTFAIISSLIGKKKSIIHSKKWIAYCIRNNYKAWTQMMERKCPYYNVIETI